MQKGASCPCLAVFCFLKFLRVRERSAEILLWWEGRGEEFHSCVSERLGHTW